MLGVYVFSRQTEDCFRCFNRIPTIRYSDFAGDPLPQSGRESTVERKQSYANEDLSLQLIHHLSGLRQRIASDDLADADQNSFSSMLLEEDAINNSHYKV